MAVKETEYLSEIVKKAQAGDNDAFTELYILTYSKQCAYAKKYLRDEENAYDAVQEVYILAFKGISSLKEPRYFMTWLTKINSRVCYEMKMKQEKRGTVDSEEMETVPDEALDSNPEQSMMQEMQHEELKEAIENLPAKEREAIKLKYFAGMQLKDIAEVMNCSVSSVTRYLSRGYETIKEKWNYEEGGH